MKFERSKGDLGQFLRIMQMIFDTSAIEQTHEFALFLGSWWMEARDIPAGLRQLRYFFSWVGRPLS